MSYNCLGCQLEMLECYNWQQLGFDSGLIFEENKKYGKHCFVFVLDKSGEFIIEC